MECIHENLKSAVHAKLTANASDCLDIWLPNHNLLPLFLYIRKVF